MIKRGDFFHCAPCHRTVQARGTSRGRRTFAALSLATTGRTEFRGQIRPTYPFCVHCKRRMQRRSALKAFRCGNCGASVMAVSSKAARVSKRVEVLELLNQGYSRNQVLEKAHTNWHIINEMMAQANPRLCACGQPFHHRTRCFKRRWSWAEQRSDFDNLMVRVRRALQSGLDEEVRAELANMMLVDVAESIERVIKQAPEYLRRYKRMYPQRVSIEGLEIAG